MDEPIPERCRVVAWRPAVPGIREVFHARIVGYRYPTHCHDTWTVLIVDDGAIQYDLDTRHHGAAGPSVSILPPGVAHNGYPSWRSGRFRKRNLYLDSRFLPHNLVGRAVDESTFEDVALRAAISALHARLVAPDLLDVEARLAAIAERFQHRLQPRPPVVRHPDPTIADHLREYLDDHLTSDVTLKNAAQLLDRSVAHLVRSFTRRYRIAPHAYVIGARIDLARELLLQGMPPARVAVETGFHDQAHLNRHFTRHVSVPPARYAASFTRSMVLEGPARRAPAWPRRRPGTGCTPD